MAINKHLKNRSRLSNFSLQFFFTNNVMDHVGFKFLRILKSDEFMQLLQVGIEKFYCQLCMFYLFEWLITLQILFVSKIKLNQQNIFGLSLFSRTLNCLVCLLSYQVRPCVKFDKMQFVMYSLILCGSIIICLNQCGFQ